MSNNDLIIEKMFQLSDLYWRSFIPNENGSYDINDDRYEQYASLYEETETLVKNGIIPDFIKKDIEFALAYCKAIKLRLFMASMRSALGKVMSAEEFAYQQYPFIVHFKTLLIWLRTKNKNQFPEYSLILLNSHLANSIGVMAPEYFHKKNKYIQGEIYGLGGYILVAGTKDRCIFKLYNQYVDTDFDIKANSNEIKEYEVAIEDGNFVLEETNYFVDSIMSM